MPINFHDQNLQRSYALREANESWRNWIEGKINLQGKSVLDLGCGGGIYSRALAAMGAADVLGMDYSESMLEGARSNLPADHQIRYQQGNALRTGLNDASFDVILERALIHHVQDLDVCFTEAYRLLKPGGQLIVQDRTPEDCLLPGSASHIRGYFAERFPHLAAVEAERRHTSDQVLRSLRKAGFKSINEEKLWEVRRIYEDLQDLRHDLLERRGRSILHELNDSELTEIVEYIEAEMIKVSSRPIVEQDRWTIWFAVK
ncbi:SAM-dependent methyltransferase [Paenibacillus albiflavus]|uniref:SAM-dependent methyltransferase n=1 Tax=Paenibacillus albiflavus TaxID=2545760 RepID=A0A4R4ENX1_9BACL|nr:class I SAM-dependent methyltransferase [Paenibacillus albiflavus]TCZ81160.1 SAM-dependent methyltransferase [Paenibacillus albiflavus]